MQSDNAQWLLHSRQVLIEIQETESSLANAETGQRGYLLTSDTEYLSPYESAVAELAPHIDNLAHLTADNPVQQKNIADLRLLVSEKMDELSQTIELFRSGKPDDAKALVMSDKGLLIMDQLRLLPCPDEA